MMWRIVFIGLIIWLVLTIVKRSTRKPRAPKVSGSHQADGEDMVQCAHCAVHLPRSEAFLVNGTIYCSKAHIQSK